MGKHWKKLLIALLSVMMLCSGCVIQQNYNSPSTDSEGQVIEGIESSEENVSGVETSESEVGELSEEKANSNSSETSKEETSLVEESSGETAETSPAPEENSSGKEESSSQKENSQNGKEESSSVQPKDGTKEESSASSVQPGKTETAKTPTTSVTMLDVGQGLSILVESDGHYLLYDGGGRDHSSYVVSYLKSQNVTSIDYIVTSHYDEDHIAGLVGVMNTCSVGKVLRPDYERDTTIYKSYIQMLGQNGAVSVFPSVGDTYTLGKATFVVLAPERIDDKDGNNNSVVIEIFDGDFSCLISGDAEEYEEGRLCARPEAKDCVLYVAGHHGSASSTSDVMLDKFKPEFVFVSCGAGNSYGHPHEETMDKFKRNDIHVFRSDIQQEVTCFTDGKTVWFDKEPCDDYTPGNRTAAKDSSVIVDDNIERENMYVLNTKTMKFHRPSCDSAAKISDKNRVESNLTREELIEQGYDPCGSCKP